MLKSALFTLCLILLLTGCGYRIGQGDSVSQYHTISIPYVDGDWDGALTSAVIQEVARSSRLRYVHSGGGLLLKIDLVDVSNENIGFRYERNKKEDEKRSIVPNETRLFGLVQVSLIETGSGKTIMGPVQIEAEADFDHDYYTVRDGVNIFSLGQVTDMDEAEDVAKKPLYRYLARKIVDYINNNW